jgi:hypothetical protein
LKKGQIVFLHNVSTHKVDGVEEAIEARGARAVFLPAYSPDLNPIEQLFARLSKMKAAALRRSSRIDDAHAYHPQRRQARHEEILAAARLDEFWQVRADERSLSADRIDRNDEFLVARQART